MKSPIPSSHRSSARQSGFVGERAAQLLTHQRAQAIHGELLAGRIPTARLLDEAWAACQAEEKDAMRSGVLRQANQTEEATSNTPDFDSLSDAEIDLLYHGVLRKVASDAHNQGS